MSLTQNWLYGKLGLSCPVNGWSGIGNTIEPSVRPTEEIGDALHYVLQIADVDVRMLEVYYCTIFLGGIPKCYPALVPVMELFDDLADSLGRFIVTVGSA